MRDRFVQIESEVCHMNMHSVRLKEILMTWIHTSCALFFFSFTQLMITHVLFTLSAASHDAVLRELSLLIQILFFSCTSPIFKTLVTFDLPKFKDRLTRDPYSRHGIPTGGNANRNDTVFRLLDQIQNEAEISNFFDDFAVSCRNPSPLPRKNERKNYLRIDS